jgi:hypothetical protein
MSARFPICADYSRCPSVVPLWLLLLRDSPQPQNGWLNPPIPLSGLHRSRNGARQLPIALLRVGPISAGAIRVSILSMGLGPVRPGLGTTCLLNSSVLGATKEPGMTETVTEVVVGTGAISTAKSTSKTISITAMWKVGVPSETTAATGATVPGGTAGTAGHPIAGAGGVAAHRVGVWLG